MSAHDLGLLTPRRLANKFNGWTEVRTMDRAWNRLHAFYIVASNGGKVKRPQDLYEIEGIDNIVSPYFKPKEVDKLLNKWGRTLPGYKELNKAELLQLKQEEINNNLTDGREIG